jgi:hypothetical protein
MEEFLIACVLPLVVVAMVYEWVTGSTIRRCHFCHCTYQEGVHGAVIRGVSCCDDCGQPDGPGGYLLNS